jgi:hypothetical protein
LPTPESAPILLRMNDSRPPNSSAWREGASPGGALDAVRFRAALMTTFPELLTELARVDPTNLHEHARCLGRHVARSIALSNQAAAKKAFEFLASAIELASPEVGNALDVSLFEPLALPDSESDRRWVLALMPPALEVAWRNAHELRQRLLDNAE